MTLRLRDWGMGSVPQTPSDFPMWRIKHPINPELYYSAREAHYVRDGWTTWTNIERYARFPNPDPERLWESFGWAISIFYGVEKP